MLANIQTQSKVITYETVSPRCIFSWFLGIWTTSSWLYGQWPLCGHCHPLHYTITTSPHLWAQLALVSRSLSVPVSLLQSDGISCSAHTWKFWTSVNLLWCSSLPIRMLSAITSCCILWMDCWEFLHLLGSFSLTLRLFPPFEHLFNGGEVQSFLNLWVSPNSHFLILWGRIRSISQLCLLPLLLKAGNCLSEVHHSHPYAEPLHL